nr:MAG TPA: hypothetical protein [Caudoviricetes sp.]
MLLNGTSSGSAYDTQANTATSLTIENGANPRI